MPAHASGEVGLAQGLGMRLFAFGGPLWRTGCLGVREAWCQLGTLFSVGMYRLLRSSLQRRQAPRVPLTRLFLCSRVLTLCDQQTTRLCTRGRSSPQKEAGPLLIRFGLPGVRVLKARG